MRGVDGVVPDGQGQHSDASDSLKHALERDQTVIRPKESRTLLVFMRDLAAGILRVDLLGVLLWLVRLLFALAFEGELGRHLARVLHLLGDVGRRLSGVLYGNFSETDGGGEAR